MKDPTAWQAEFERVLEELRAGDPETPMAHPLPEPYAQVFLGSLEGWMAVGNTETSVLLCAMKLAHFNDGLFFWDGATKAAVAAVVGTAPETVSNRLSGLCRKGVLEKLGAGKYRLNPKLCWKGSRRSRRDLLFPDAPLAEPDTATNFAEGE